MSRLLISGAGVVSAAGIGVTPMTRALAAGRPVLNDVTGLGPRPLPYAAAPAFAAFDVRALLGRKGTSFLDRATGLALVACGAAIEDSGVAAAACSRERIGVALGTTVGSLRSSSEYSEETLTAERPYLVNPVLFPNTVMNCAAGQAAIWYGLKGVNSTVAGGRLGFLAALRYAVNVLRRGYADAMLTGAVEEFTPHSAWAHRVLGGPGLPGEAAAVFVLERDGGDRDPARRPLAELAAVACGYHPGGGPGGLAGRLAACIADVLDRAGLRAGQLGWLALSEGGGPDDGPIAAAATARAREAGPAEQIRVREVLGDCGAAAGAVQFAALLARRGEQADSGGAGLIAGWTPEGAFGAAVVTGQADAGSDRR